MKFGKWKGIGIYPLGVWNNPGLHVDIRPTQSLYFAKKIGTYVDIKLWPDYRKAMALI